MRERGELAGPVSGPVVASTEQVKTRFRDVFRLFQGVGRGHVGLLGSASLGGLLLHRPMGQEA